MCSRGNAKGMSLVLDPIKCILIRSHSCQTGQLVSRDSHIKSADVQVSGLLIAGKLAGKDMLCPGGALASSKNQHACR